MDRILLDGLKHELHRKCLKCIGCSTALAVEGACRAKVFNGEPLCATCFAKRSQTTVDLSKACAGCGESISSRALRAMDKQWHSACFVCSEPECGARLKGQYFAIRGLPYCERHQFSVGPKRPGIFGAGAAGAAGGDDEDDAIYSTAKFTSEYDEVAGGGDDDYVSLSESAARDAAYDNGDAFASGALPAADATYDNGDAFPGGAPPAADATYDNGDAFAGGGAPAADATYDNGDAFAGQAAPAADATYDNGDAFVGQAAPAADATYDNGDAFAGQAAPAADATYDNGDAFTSKEPRSLFKIAGHASSDGAEDCCTDDTNVSAEVERRVQKEIELRRAEIEARVRAEVEREVSSSGAKPAKGGEKELLSAWLQPPSSPGNVRRVMKEMDAPSTSSVPFPRRSASQR